MVESEKNLISLVGKGKMFLCILHKGSCCTKRKIFSKLHLMCEVGKSPPRVFASLPTAKMAYSNERVGVNWSTYLSSSFLPSTHPTS